MELPTTKLADILKQSRFKLERPKGSSLPKMRDDLAKRISAGETWEMALVQGSDADDAGGMVLLRRGTESGTFEGVFYRAANCGADRENVEMTAVMLYMLGVGTSSDDLHQSFLKTYSKVKVTGLNTPKPVCEPID